MSNDTQRTFVAGRNVIIEGKYCTVELFRLASGRSLAAVTVASAPISNASMSPTVDEKAVRQPKQQGMLPASSNGEGKKRPVSKTHGRETTRQQKTRAPRRHQHTKSLLRDWMERLIP